MDEGRDLSGLHRGARGGRGRGKEGSVPGGDGCIR